VHALAGIMKKVLYSARQILRRIERGQFHGNWIPTVPRNYVVWERFAKETGSRGVFLSSGRIENGAVSELSAPHRRRGHGGNLWCCVHFARSLPAPEQKSLIPAHRPAECCGELILNKQSLS